jgi:hypothetical protein
LAACEGRLPDFGRGRFGLELVIFSGSVSGERRIIAAARLLRGRSGPRARTKQLALPGYEQLLKAAHTFNLLDARGAISVTERAAYIGRIRNLARSVAQSYVRSEERRVGKECRRLCRSRWSPYH